MCLVPTAPSSVPGGETVRHAADSRGLRGGKYAELTRSGGDGPSDLYCLLRVCLSFLSVLPVFRKSLELNAEDGAGHSSEILNKAVGMGCIGCAT